VSLSIYDMSGQRIRQPVDEHQQAGYYELEWNGRDASGPGLRPPEGETHNDTRRVTVVLVKQKGEWKGVHVHLSYLTPVNPE
jgi:flagellar hook assembly protein FlgD